MKEKHIQKKNLHTNYNFTKFDKLKKLMILKMQLNNGTQPQNCS